MPILRSLVLVFGQLHSLLGHFLHFWGCDLVNRTLVRGKYLLNLLNSFLLLLVGLSETFQDALLLALKTPSLAVPLANLDDLLLDDMILLHADLSPFLRSNTIHPLLSLHFLGFDQHAFLFHLTHLLLFLLFTHFSDLVRFFLDLGGLVQLELV